MAAGVFVSASLCPCVHKHALMCEAIYMCVHVCARYVLQGRELPGMGG